MTAASPIHFPPNYIRIGINPINSTSICEMATSSSVVTTLVRSEYLADANFIAAIVGALLFGIVCVFYVNMPIKLEAQRVSDSSNKLADVQGNSDSGGMAIYTPPGKSSPDRAVLQELHEEKELVTYSVDGNVVLDLAVDDDSSCNSSVCSYESPISVELLHIAAREAKIGDEQPSLPASPRRSIPVEPIEILATSSSGSTLVGLLSPSSADSEGSSVPVSDHALGTRLVAFSTGFESTAETVTETVPGISGAQPCRRGTRQFVQFGDDVSVAGTPCLVAFDSKVDDCEHDRTDGPFVTLGTETEREDLCALGDDDDDSFVRNDDTALGCFEDERSALVLRPSAPLVGHGPMALAHDSDCNYSFSDHSSCDADGEYEVGDDSDEDELSDSDAQPLRARWSRRNTGGPVRGFSSPRHRHARKRTPVYADLESDDDTVSSLGDEGVEDFLPTQEHYNDDGNLILDFALEDDGSDLPVMLEIGDDSENGGAHGYVTGSSESEWEDYCDDSSQSDWSSSELPDSSVHEQMDDQSIPKPTFVVLNDGELSASNGAFDCGVTDDEEVQQCVFVSLSDDTSEVNQYVSFGDDG